MPEEKKAAEGGDGKVVFDADGFKKELMASNAEMSRRTTEHIMEQVNATIQGAIKGLSAAKTPAAAEGAVDAGLEDLAEEMKSLEINGKQAKSLMSMFSKILKKSAPEFKDEVKNEVYSETAAANKKASFEAEAASLYPEVLDKNSQLFQQAQAEWKDLSDGEKGGPRATYTAIMRAANRLGIKARSLADIKAQDARSETGEPSGGKGGKDDKVTEKDLTFAESFGVKDKKGYEKNLQLVRAKHSRAA